MATTMEERLQRARAAGSDAERRTLLATAEAHARDAFERHAVAAAWLAAGDRAAAAGCLDEALRTAGHEVWLHRNMAETWTRLGDAAAATRALRAFEAKLACAGASPGYEWRLLAEGFAVLPDHAAVQRCLGAGRAHAASADDCCSIARGYVELLADRGTALELLHRAEELASAAPASLADAPDVAPWWAIAGAWTELFDDRDRARASLDEGLARAADVGGCATIAAAWASLAADRVGGLADVRRCLAKGRLLARTFDEWLDLAEATYEHGDDAEALRDCLRAAGRRAATAAERRRLAHAARAWLPAGDAEAYGPAGLAPAELAPPGPTDLGFDRDAGALFDWLRGRIDARALAAIAAEDYGRDQHAHLAALRDVVRTGLVPVPLPWHPREVASLARWREGEQVDHAVRAFCCTLLCLDALGEGCASGSEDTIVVLVESCCALGREALGHLPGLLVALAGQGQGRDQATAAMTTLALLLASIRLDAGDPRLDALAHHLLELEAACARSGYAHAEHGWLLGAGGFDQRIGVWRELVHDTFGGLDVDASTRPSLARVAVALRAPATGA
jgi:hypothetical protein